MKKTLSLAISLASYLSLAPLALAQTTESSACPPDAGFANLCNITGGNMGQVVGVIIQAIFIFAVLAALIYLVWGGFKWLISGGDKSAVGSAREHIIAALVGLVIIFLSYFILNFILTLFFGDTFSLTKISLPSIPTLNSTPAD